MNSSYLLRLGKIKGKNGILVALKHNKREFQRESGARLNIDPSRTKLNYSLTTNQTSEEISKNADLLIFNAGIKAIRKNGVMAVEILFSLPVQWHQYHTNDFFLDCFKWVGKNFLGELLSFDVHLDEHAPHAHAVILPLVDGRMNGSDMVGNKTNLKRLLDLFYLEVGIKHGLVKSGKKNFQQLACQSLRS